MISIEAHNRNTFGRSDKNPKTQTKERQLDDRTDILVSIVKSPPGINDRELFRKLNHFLSFLFTHYLKYSS